MRSHSQQILALAPRGAIRANLLVPVGLATLVLMNALAGRPAAQQPQTPDALAIDSSGNVEVAANFRASGNVTGKNITALEERLKSLEIRFSDLVNNNVSILSNRIGAVERRTTQWRRGQDSCIKVLI